MKLNDLKRKKPNFIGTIISSNEYVLPVSVEMLPTFEVKLKLGDKEFVVQLNEDGEPINNDEFILFTGKTLSRDAPIPKAFEEMISNMNILDWMRTMMVTFKAMEEMQKRESDK